jgi:large subunit ribosomal protein L29
MKISNSNSKDNMSMSTQELIKELKETEKVLFDLRFKKATRQPFKPHEIKATKKKVAILKTILRSKFLD